MLHFTRIDADHIRLEGKVGDAMLAMSLERFDASKMLLVTRGFPLDPRLLVQPLAARRGAG